VPTAPDVSFPSPSIINETWNGFFNFGGGNILPVPFSPTDTYTWENTVTPCGGFCGVPKGSANDEIAGFSVVDVNANVDSLDAIDGVSGPFVDDKGTLAFVLVGAVPEPGTFSLMLIGVGLLVLMMRKRIARGLPQAT
jgi:hypothetical protein